MRKNLSNASGQVKFSTVYLRILTNYFQIIFMAITYGLDWTDWFKQVFSGFAAIASSQDIIFSFDCLMHDPVVHPIYTKVLILLIVPFIYLIASFFGWKIVYWKRNKKSKPGKYIMMSYMVLYFISFPVACNILFVVLHC